MSDEMLRAVVGVLLLPSLAAAQTSSEREGGPSPADAQVPPSGLSLSGPTGLLRVPNALVQPPGVIRAGATETPSGVDERFPGDRSRWQFTLGLMPRVEFGGTYHGHLRDLAYHAKLQLLPERGAAPAIAVGTTDERARHGLHRTRYVVFSSGGRGWWGGRLRGSVGWAEGGLSGPFAGLEARVARPLTLLAEYDTKQANFGLRVTPTPRTQLDLARVKGGWTGQLNYGFGLSHSSREPIRVTLPRAPDPAGPQAVADRVQEAVSALGMENVRSEVGEAPRGLTAVVFYENRRYTRDETDALSRVLAATVAATPESVARVVVVATKLQTPVLRVSVDPKEYARFLRGELSPKAFGREIAIDHSGASPLRDVEAARTPLRRSTRLTGDVVLVPVNRFIIGSEKTSFSARNVLRPELTADLARGLSLHAAHGFQVSGTLGTYLNRLHADNAAYLSYVCRPMPEIIARVAGGDFLGKREGGAAEAVFTPKGDRFTVRGFAGLLADRRYYGADELRWACLGDVRYYVPTLDLSLFATGGQYLNTDRGYTVGLRRYFENAEVALQWRHTDLGRVVVLSVAVPIGPQRSPRPHPLRVRVVDRFAESMRALNTGPGQRGFISVASSIGNQLNDFDLTDTLLNRDRLRASYLRAHLADLARGAAEVASPGGE